MWSNRKARFIFIVSVIVIMNIAIRIVGTSDFRNFVVSFDTAVVLGFAILGLLISWLLAFKPAEFKQSIERSMAKRAAKDILK